MTAPRIIHPWPLRLTHWLNALAILLMLGSGLQIYNASPLFDFRFPALLTFGDWLGAAIAWHLAIMWLLLGNFCAYFLWSLATRHYRAFSLRPRDVTADLRAALSFSLRHEPGRYNAVQKFLYLFVLFAGLVIVVSGLAIWKPVQLWFFCDLLGGYWSARYVHFFAMASIAGFLAIHVLLTLLVPRTLPPMLTGRALGPPA